MILDDSIKEQELMEPVQVAVEAMVDRILERMAQEDPDMSWEADLRKLSDDPILGPFVLVVIAQIHALDNYYNGVI